MTERQGRPKTYEEQFYDDVRANPNYFSDAKEGLEKWNSWTLHHFSVMYAREVLNPTILADEEVPNTTPVNLSYELGEVLKEYFKFLAGQAGVECPPDDHEQWSQILGRIVDAYREKHGA